jgi:cobyrinic acid a,c-diamide synthase
MDPMPETVRRAYAEPAEGYRVNAVLGSYIHLHFLSCPGFAAGFVQECAERRAKK